MGRYQSNLARDVLDTILSIQPKDSGGGGETRETVVYRLAEEFLSKLPRNYVDFEVNSTQLDHTVLLTDVLKENYVENAFIRQIKIKYATTLKLVVQRIKTSNAFLPHDALQCKARYCYHMSSVRPSVASRSQRVSLVVIPFCLSVCLDVCPSFRNLQPTTIDQSQPNLVGRVLGPLSAFLDPLSPILSVPEGKICKISSVSNGSPLTGILATANVTYLAI